MKMQSCCNTLKHRAAALWQKAARPTVRQTMRYDFGLYPDDHTSESDAIKFHLGGTHACPLWKLLLLAAVALMTVCITCHCRCHGNSQEK